MAKNETREILEQSIKDHEAAIAKAKAAIAKQEVTYSIGDRFLNSCGGGSYKLLLVRSDNVGEVGLIELRNGSRYGMATSVRNDNAITSAEIVRVLHGNQSFITRYWNDREQCKC